MDLIEGDILRKGSKFYRVKDFTKRGNDVVCNEILYNPKKEALVIAQEFTYINLSDVGSVYVVVREDKKQALEIVKRKHKLEQINKNINGIPE